MADLRCQSRVSLYEPRAAEGTDHSLSTRRSARANTNTLFVGVAVPKEPSAVAYVGEERGAAGVSWGTSGPRQGAIAKLIGHVLDSL